MQKLYPDFKKHSGYVLFRDFHLHPISCQKCDNPPTFKITKTFPIDDRKVLRVEVNADIGNFCQCDEFSATISDLVVSGK